MKKLQVSKSTETKHNSFSAPIQIHTCRKISKTSQGLRSHPIMTNTSVCHHLWVEQKSKTSITFKNRSSIKCVEDYFFGSRSITSLAIHATSTCYSFFGEISLKSKINSYLIQLQGLGLLGPRDPYFKRWIHGPHFLFINWDHSPTTLSIYGLGLSNESKLMAHITSLTLMANGFFNQSPYLHKMTTKPKVHHYDPSS